MAIPNKKITVTATQMTLEVTQTFENEGVTATQITNFIGLKSAFVGRGYDYVTYEPVETPSNAAEYLFNKSNISFQLFEIDTVTIDSVTTNGSDYDTIMELCAAIDAVFLA